MHTPVSLANQLATARAAYYHGGTPIMDDAEYDRLEDQLRRMDPNHPILAEVGAPAVGHLQKAKHPAWASMGSLFKVNTPLELEDWAGGLGTGGNGPYHVSLKGDGASMALYYLHGKLQQAISRGDGDEGEDITANARLMKDVPAFLTYPFSGVIRCEVVLYVSDWEVIDPEMSTNPRNVGNGIMGRKNGVQSELLTARAFDMDANPGHPSAIVTLTETEKFKELERLGFVTIPWETCDTLDAVGVYFRRIAEARSSLPFWIDGIVVRHDDLEVQRQAGVRDNRPKGQRAWKFDAEGATTMLRGVELTVGHTGNIIPTGVLEPVEIGGTTISRVLLNNWEEIRRLNVQLGDMVHVIKANDIIPKVTRVVTESKERHPIMEPEKCPCCGGVTARTTNTDGSSGVMTTCTNVDDCPAQSLGKIKRWIKSLNILGIGDSLLEALYEGKLILTPADLYSLGVNDIKNVVINEEKGIRLGKSRAQGVIEEISKTTSLTIPQFMGSLGIKFLGKRRVELMIEAAPELGLSLDRWLDGSLAGELGGKAGVPEIGREIAEGIRKVRPVIDALRFWIVLVTAPAVIPTTHVQPEGGKKICISGKLPSGRTKAYYLEPLGSHGHILMDSVNATTDILVLADPDSNSSKAQKARKMGIEIIGEDDLQKYT